MRSMFAAFCALVTVLFLSVSQASASEIQVLLQAHRDSYSGGSQNFYVSASGGYSTDVSSMEISSPTGDTFWTMTDNSASGFSTFDDLRPVMNGAWSLLIDKGLPTARSYSFNVNIDAVSTDTNLAEVYVTSPTHLAVLTTDPFPTITFHNPGGFDWAYMNLFGPTGFTSPDGAISATATSWTAVDPLIPGQYGFNYQLYTNTAPQVVFSDLTLLSGAPGDDVSFSATYASIGYRTFSEQAPEPASLMLLGTGLMGLFGVARRKLAH